MVLFFLKLLNCIKNINKLKFTFNNGYLGSCIDEERSETRYVMRIAELCESSNLWTHIALLNSIEKYACMSDV